MSPEWQKVQSAADLVLALLVASIYAQLSSGSCRNSGSGHVKNTEIGSE